MTPACTVAGMAPTHAELEARIARLEHTLGTGADPAEQRAARTELAACLATRFMQFGGGDADRVRVEQLAGEVLADGAASAKQRQLMSMLLPTLTMLSVTPAAALRGHDAAVNAETLRLTEQWQAETGSDAVSAGLDRLAAQLGAVDPAGLPPEIRWILDSFRAATGLMSDVSQPDWDGTVAPAVTAPLRQALDTAPARAPGTDLLRGLVTWLDPSADPVGELEAAIAGLPGDTLLAPLLRRDLAEALVRGPELGHHPDALRRATDLLRHAAADMAPNHPMRDETERMLAGALVAVAATDQDRDQAEAAGRLAADLVARSTDPDDRARRGADLFLTSLVGLLRARTGDDPDPTGAVRDLVAAVEVLPEGHPLRPVALGQLGAVLADRHLVDGLLADADSAVDLLDHAVRVVGAGPDDGVIACVAAVVRVTRAMRTGDVTDLAGAVVALRDGLDRLPATHLLRPNFELVLKIAELRATTRDGRMGAAALTELRRAADTRPPVGVPGAVVATMVGALDTLGGLVNGDTEAVDDALTRMEADLDMPVATPALRAGQLALLGKAYLAAAGTGTAVPDAPARAVAHLTEARAQLGERRADVVRVAVLSDLALALRAVGDRGGSRRVALACLQAYAAIVLLQSGVAHALVTARGAAAEATRLMRWALADGDSYGAVQAVELGRGLALHAATTTTGVPALLEKAGRQDLAQAWRADARAQQHDPALPTDAADAAEPDYAAAAADLRYRVLDVLRSTLDGRRLFAPPSPRAVGRGLRELGRDVLAYLVPGDTDTGGHVLLVDPDGQVTPVDAARLRLDPGGPVATYLAAQRPDGGEPAVRRSTLERLADWAGPAAMEPLLGALDAGDRPPRVVLVPGGPLGVVPWAAARLPGRGAPVRHACEVAVLSTAASSRQLLDVARRRLLPVDRGQTLVVDPTGELPGAAREADALVRAFYPTATVLDGVAASPANVLAVFAAAVPEIGLLELCCHAHVGGTADTGHLRLTAPLTIADVLRRAAGREPWGDGPTVVFGACDTDVTWADFDESLTLATTCLAAGAAAVVGARWAVLDHLTAVAMFALHHFLTACREPAADALRSAQLWMLDPRREPLPGMPDDLARYAHRSTVADLTVWAAFAHHGR